MPMPPFQGSITALITPFKDGKVDATAFQRLVEWQIDQGTHGLVPVRDHRRIARRSPMRSISASSSFASRRPRAACR